MKGGALKSRGLEKFQRVFLEEIIKLQMQGKPEEIAALRDDYERRMRAGEMPIEMLMKTDTLQDSLEKYRQKIGAGGRNRAAAYELPWAAESLQTAIKSATTSSHPEKVAAYEAAKLASDFDPQNATRIGLLRREARRAGEEVWWCRADQRESCAPRELAL